MVTARIVSSVALHADRHAEIGRYRRLTAILMPRNSRRNTTRS
jgi:hypothetical protein